MLCAMEWLAFLVMYFRKRWMQRKILEGNSKCHSSEHNDDKKRNTPIVDMKTVLMDLIEYQMR